MENNNIISVRVEVPGLELLARAVMALASQGNGIKEGRPSPIAPTSVSAVSNTGSAPMSASGVVPQVPTAQSLVAQNSMQQIPTQQTPTSTTVPTAPMVPTATTPLAPTAPMPVAPAAQNGTSQIPTTTVPVTHTMDELAVAASQLVNAGKQQRLLEILSGFGASSLMELPQEKYAAFAGCLKAEGVKF